jgi:hypothetical protein
MRGRYTAMAVGRLEVLLELDPHHEPQRFVEKRSVAVLLRGSGCVGVEIRRHPQACMQASKVSVQPCAIEHKPRRPTPEFFACLIMFISVCNAN